MKRKGPKSKTLLYRPQNKQIRVNNYSAQWLRRGFPWVYEKEVEAKGPKASGFVQIVDGRGEVLGHGIADTGWIAARVFRRDGPICEEFVNSQLDRAASLREYVVDPKTNAFRLVHGENDGLPGIRINWWSHYADIVLDSPSLGVLIQPIVTWLTERFSPRGIRLCYRPDPRDDRDFKHVEPPPQWLQGHPPPGAVRVQERGLNVDVLLQDGADVGLYTDMREVRAWLEPHWGGRRVLNTFAYTGVFSLAAAMHGASSVTTVDLSAQYLERAENNFRANDLMPEHYEFIQSDVFKAMDRLRRTGEQFDLVVLDPPSFSHSSAGIWSSKRDMPRLVAASFRLLDDEGWIVAASNQGDLSPKDFRGFITEGARKANVRAQEIWFGGQGPDFPAATWFPEGRYLKVGVWRKVPV